MSAWDVIVVGGGIAGVSAVRTLVEQKAERVLLVNAEEQLPYKRTKLSKNLANDTPVDAFSLHSKEWYSEHRVTLVNGTSVSQIDQVNRSVTLDDDSVHSYGALVFATGAEPLYPPTVQSREAGSYHVLRSAADLEALRAAARKARRVLVDGMGVLAVEVAAELRKLGKKVTLVGATPQVMPRHLNERAGEIMEGLLNENGVRLRFQEEILSFQRRDRGDFTVATIRESAHYDLVVFCIGVQPRTELARRAGTEVGRGIVVDRYLQTSANGIFAAGDCAEHSDGFVSDLWHAAEYQGQVAGHNALAASRGSEAYREIDDLSFRLKCTVFDHYFFSVGKPRNPLAYEIEEHEAGDAYRCFYFSEGSLIGVIMIDDKERAKEYEQAVKERWPRERTLDAFLSTVGGSSG